MSTRRTIVRSVSLDTDLALWVEERAAGENRSVSNFVNTLLGRLRARAGPPAPAVRLTGLTVVKPALQTVLPPGRAPSRPLPPPPQP